MTINKTNVYLDIDEITSDFGFSFATSDDVLDETPEYSSAQEEVNDLKQRLYAINKIYMPLLESLNKDPDKDFIKWPGRKSILDKHIAKLKSLTNI